MQGSVFQLNTKKETSQERGIPKKQVQKVKITKSGCEGDYNRYRTEKKQNDPNKAVLLIPKETIDELNKEGWPIQPGDLGENITTQGIAYQEIEPGTKWQIEEVLLEITQPCTPCTNLHVLPYVGLMKTPAFIKTMLNRRGWYAKVIHEGTIMTSTTIKKITNSDQEDLQDP